MSEHSALSDYLQSQGAQFKKWFGLSLPETIKGFESEVAASRREFACFDQNFRSIVEISGADAVSVIDRITSNDIKNLKEGCGAQTGFLNPQAKVIATAYVLRKKDRMWLDVQCDLAGKLINYIEKFIFSEDIKLVNKAGELACLGIEGISAQAALKQIGISEPDLPKHSEHTEIKLNKFSLTVFGRGWSSYGSGGFAIILEKNNLAAFLKILDSAGSQIQWAGMKTINLLRIENSVPWYGFDMDENYLLPETGLEDAVSYNKGCYTGQEIVARIKSRGQLKRKLTRFLINSSSVPQSQTEIKFNDLPIGHITSAEFDPEKGAVLALGYLKVDCIESKNLFKVNGSEARLLIS